MRDKSGRFVKGHTLLTPWDKTTGRFIKSVKEKLPLQNSLEAKVDRILQEHNVL